MAVLNVNYIAWIITVLEAINRNLNFIFDLYNYFSVELKTLKRQGVTKVSFLKQNTAFFNLKRNQFLECQSKMLKEASKFLLPMLNFQSHWRPVGCNFGAPKNMGGLCFQVLGS